MKLFLFSNWISLFDWVFEEWKRYCFLVHVLFLDFHWVTQDTISIKIGLTFFLRRCFDVIINRFTSSILPRITGFDLSVSVIIQVFLYLRIVRLAFFGWSTTIHMRFISRNGTISHPAFCPCWIISYCQHFISQIWHLWWLAFFVEWGPRIYCLV